MWGSVKARMGVSNRRGRAQGGRAWGHDNGMPAVARTRGAVRHVRCGINDLWRLRPGKWSDQCAGRAERGDDGASVGERVGGPIERGANGWDRAARVIPGRQADELGGECVAAGGAGGGVALVRVRIAVMGRVVVRHRGLVMIGHGDAADGFHHHARREGERAEYPEKGRQPSVHASDVGRRSQPGKAISDRTDRLRRLVRNRSNQLALGSRPRGRHGAAIS